MVIRKCHLAISAFFMCLLSCKADDPRLVISDVEHGSLSSATETISNSTAKPDFNISAPLINATSPQPSVLISSSSVPSQPSIVTPTSAFISSSTIKETPPPIPTPSTVKPDPDTTTTEKPTPTPKPLTTTSTTVPTKPSTTSTITPSTTSSSTEKPTITTPKHVTTAIPVTTAAPAPHHNRQFDGPSFIGGIVLASGLMAIGFVAFKFYKARTERNYHTL